MATKFITVSIEIMRDANLNQSQKFLLAEIEQLTTLEKGCIASNLHFSNLIGISKENVSKNINDLEKKGYICAEIVKGSRNHTRIITLTKIVRPPYQNSKTPLSNRQETKGNKQSNTTVNKTVNKTIKESGAVCEIPCEYPNVNQNAFNEWMAYKKYKSKSAITKTLNMLNKYDYQTQQEMVDLSIGNEYKGLFPPKQQKQMQSFKQQDAKRTEDALGAFLAAREQGFDLRNISSEDDVEDLEVIENG